MKVSMLVSQASLALMLSLFVSCTSSDDEKTTTEAVQPEQPAEGAKTEEAPAEPAKGESESSATEKTPDAPPEDNEASPIKEEATTNQVEQAPAADFFVAVTHLNVRSGPGMEHGVVEVLTFQSPVKSLGTEKTIWVKLGEGRYISKNYLAATLPSEPIAVEASESQMKRPMAHEELPMDKSATSAEVNSDDEPAAEEPTEENLQPESDEASDSQE